MNEIKPEQILGKAVEYLDEQAMWDVKYKIKQIQGQYVIVIDLENSPAFLDILEEDLVKTINGIDMDLDFEDVDEQDIKIDVGQANTRIFCENEDSYVLAFNPPLQSETLADYY